MFKHLYEVRPLEPPVEVTTLAVVFVLLAEVCDAVVTGFRLATNFFFLVIIFHATVLFGACSRSSQNLLAEPVINKLPAVEQNFRGK